MATSSSLTFKVERKEPELIAPSKPTPYEFKPLSDLDDQKGLWKHSQGIQLYSYNEKMEGRDPVKVIKQAVADALVYYYPLAGRLREGDDGKLMVECSGEGVLFIEANAKITMEEFTGIMLPPVPCAEELLYDVPGSAAILHSPLVLIQVTRLLCGGFTVAARTNHTMCDAIGILEFFRTISEMASGASSPSVYPVWQRELLNARHPLQVSCIHSAYQEIENTVNVPLDDIAQLSFFFGLEEISKLRNQVEPHILNFSKFEILTAFFWRCRSIALNLSPDHIVPLTFAVNARKKFNPPLPVGYYGNAFGKPIALSTAGELCNNSLGYALELVKKAKEDVNEEFMRSTIDFLVKNGRPSFSTGRIYHVSDLTSVAFKNIDYGWGKAIYGGPLRWGRPATYFISSKNNKGDDGIVATIGLPEAVMKRFIMEVEKIVSVQHF